MVKFVKSKSINMVFYSQWDSYIEWKNKLLKQNIILLHWPKDFIKGQSYPSIQGAIVWDPPDDLWRVFPNLKIIQSLGAGVDHILNKSYPKNIPIVKLNDPDLNNQMSEYVLLSVIYCYRNFFKYAINKNNKVWNQLPIFNKKDFIITVLGYGTIAKLIIKKLISMGFSLNVWGRKKRNLKKVNYFSGIGQFHNSIKNSSCLISLLPNTLGTNNIIGLTEFTLLKKGSYFINVGRGTTVNEQELIYSLNNLVLSGAVLDVFNEEPLSTNSMLWNADNVILTPHVAGITNATDYSAALLRSNFTALLNNKKVKNKVSTIIGY